MASQQSTPANTDAVASDAPGIREPVGVRRRPSVLSVGLSRTLIELKQFFREREAVIFIFAFPVILLFIFGSVFDYTVDGTNVSFTQYFLAGMVASGLMIVSFQSLAISIAIERDDGTLKRLQGTPMPPASYFVGKVGLVLVTGLLQIAFLLAAGALFFDVALPTSMDKWITFAWVAVLGITSGTLLGIAFSSVPRSGRSASAVVSPVVIVLQFISGVFFVYNQLPEWMQRVAEVFPLKWMAQGMRSVFLPDSFEAQEVSGSWQHGMTAIVLTVWAVAGLLVCLRTFRWQRRDAG
jgi:ABC-2 type transport system permease protein